jgi:hypothetical protein
MAEIKYEMMLMPNPFDKEARANGEKNWCLVKRVKPELGTSPFATSIDVVAMFNCDSDASLFQCHLFKGGGVEIDQQQRELCESWER